MPCSCLDRLGLADFAEENAGDLPFGRQRLLEIARALATEPKLLLLDEAASGLSTREKRELVELIYAIRATRRDHLPGRSRHGIGDGYLR